MAVRNCREIGENIKKIAQRLLANDTLTKLLYYTDGDPLSQQVLTTDQKNKLLNDHIRIIPYIKDIKIAHPIISLRVTSSASLDANNEFKTVIFSIEVFTPWEQWIINDDNLRPFAILGEIQSSLNNKKINGLGLMTGGDFELSYLTDDVACYVATYSITAYD